MTLYLVVLASVLTSIAQRGSKVTLSLYALDLGAGSFAVGLLGALYASFPLILAVHAGRISDRFGVRYPMLMGGTTMALALAIPALYPSLPILFASGALMGLGHIFFHVSVHNLVGSLDVAERTKNFATFSLGSSIAAFIGPSLAGFSIQYAGFREALLLLAGSAALPALAMLGYRPPSAKGEPEERTKNAFDLLAIPELRRTLIMSGVALTGIELFSFYLPIYGRSIGLAPSVIGKVLSCYAVAGFMVRWFMHRLAHRYTEIGVLTASLFLAAAAYALLPALHEAMFLGQHVAYDGIDSRIEADVAVRCCRAADVQFVHEQARLHSLRAASRAARSNVPRRGRVRARPGAGIGAAAHHHPDVQPCAEGPLGRGARDAHHGEQGDADRGAARLRRPGRRNGLGAGVPRDRRLSLRRRPAVVKIEIYWLSSGMPL